MCRQEIPADYLERPQLLELAQQKETAAAEEESSEEAYQWFYEGRNGTAELFKFFKRYHANKIEMRFNAETKKLILCVIK